MKRCAWCRDELVEQRRDARFCSQRCRQTAFRTRSHFGFESNAPEPLRFAYADPPYPGTAAKYYGREPTFAGEVDHPALIAKLRHFDGWALSTSARSLRWILPLCPASAIVCPWVKPGGVDPKTNGPHNKWEPLIVVPGRVLRPGKRDFLLAHPARRGGTLPGRKPLRFCTWMFGLLGMLPGDELVDLFPGTGIVGRAWAELSSLANRRLSLEDGSRRDEVLADASGGRQRRVAGPSLPRLEVLGDESSVPPASTTCRAGVDDGSRNDAFLVDERRVVAAGGTLR